MCTPTLNSSRGVIRCRDLAGIAHIHIRDELNDRGITVVKRIRIESNDQEKDTNTFFLPFCNTDLPKVIRTGHLQVKVDLFAPSPLRCFKCQKYGQFAWRCSSAAVCPKRVLEHESACTNTPMYVNFDGHIHRLVRNATYGKRKKKYKG